MEQQRLLLLRYIRDLVVGQRFLIRDSQIMASYSQPHSRGEVHTILDFPDIDSETIFEVVKKNDKSIRVEFVKRGREVDANTGMSLKTPGQRVSVRLNFRNNERTVVNLIVD